MRLKYCPLALTAGLLAVTSGIGPEARAQEGRRWQAHDPDRPKPVIVRPGAALGQAPSDAFVLFDGTSLDAWSGLDGSPARWVLRDGYMETAPGSGPLQTRQGFGDMQLHLEWATPTQVSGSGQGRGNSGVIIMGLYEVQVLDSYQNVTYADGQAAAIYGQYPPMVNASRGPGEWQTYDIIFRRPRFDAAGAVRAPARLTVFHNGVLVQDAEPLWGPTDWLQHRSYARHADERPLVLQDHDNPVRYRNIWVRHLPDVARPAGLASATPAARPDRGTLRRYVGEYRMSSGDEVIVFMRGQSLWLRMPGAPRRELELVPMASGRFAPRHTAGTVDFTASSAGMEIRLRFAEIDRRGQRPPPSEQPTGARSH
jgi:hypothetical protein